MDVNPEEDGDGGKEGLKKKKKKKKTLSGLDLNFEIFSEIFLSLGEIVSL